MQSHNVNTALAIFFLAIAVILIGGLVIIPVIEAADAANAISESRNKGQQGFIKSKGKGGGGGINT